MNILMVSSFLPYPLHSGGHVRLFNIIKQLSQKHSITLICEVRDYQSESDQKELEKYCKKVITIPRKKQWSFGVLFKTATSSYPFLMSGHTNSLFKHAIEHELSENEFNVVHVETFYVMQNLPKTSVPIVLVEHNIEYQVYSRFAKKVPPVIRFPFTFDVQKMKRWETYFWKQATRVVAVSEKEKQVIGKDAFVVPNGVDLSSYLFDEDKHTQKEKRILFLGDFKWVQNRDSLNVLLKTIWPEFLKEYAGSEKIVLWIVGRNIPESFTKYQSDTVILENNSDRNTQDIFRNSYILLAPIYVGGGTSFKILEAMATGVSVITTQLGAEGLNATHKKELLIGDTSGEFVSNLRNLLNDKKLYDAMRRNARKHIEENFDWKTIGKELEKVYLSTQND